MRNMIQLRKRIFFAFSIALSFCVNTLISGTTRSTISGNWSSSATWDAGVPKANDVVFISSNHVVTIDVTTANLSDLTIGANATLRGDGTGKTLIVGKGGGEDVTNFGTLDMSGGSYARLRFNKNTQWAGTGIWDINDIDFNGRTLSFTPGYYITLNIGGAGDPLSNVGSINPTSMIAFNYTGTSSQTLSPGANIKFGSLLINNPAGVLLGKNLNAANLLGDLKVETGTLSTNGFTITGTSSQVFEVYDGAILRMTASTGMPSGFSTITLGSVSTVDYGGVAQTVTALSYGHLLLSGSGNKTMPNSNVNIAGDLTVSGSAVMVPNGGTVTFNSSVGQSMAGGTFDNLVISKSGSSSVTLASIETVNGTLTLTDGYVVLGDNNLVVGSSGSISGASTSSFVVTNGSGKLVLQGGSTTAVAFPVGSSSSSYNPVTVRTGTSTDDFYVRVIGSLSPSSSNGAAAVQRTWEISEGTPGGNGTIRFSVQWNSTHEGASFTRATSVPWRATGSTWIADGVLVSLAGSDPYVEIVDVAGSLGSWAIANESAALPIQLASFTGTVLQQGDVSLMWVTLSEVNNFGFYVQRKRPTEPEYSEIFNSFVAGHGTTNEPQTYNFVDVAPGFGRWMYRLKQVDLDGTVHFVEPIEIDILTSVTEGSNTPLKIQLRQNYPNPFNPSTKISYAIPRQSHVVLRVYNLLGQEVAMLVNEVQRPGYKQVEWNASGLASGVYVYRMQSDDIVLSEKMILSR